MQPTENLNVSIANMFYAVRDVLLTTNIWTQYCKRNLMSVLLFYHGMFSLFSVLIFFCWAAYRKLKTKYTRNVFSMHVTCLNKICGFV